MGVVIGLDIGGSTTKTVALRDKTVIGYQVVTADDVVASAYGALGKFLNHHRLFPKDLDCVMVTGVGSTYLTGPLLGVPTVKVEEFISIGLGGSYMAGLDRAVVVSMGTGTAYVRVEDGEVRHLIGSGVGGGTLLGLSRCLLGTRDISRFNELAASGNLSKIDLTVADISHSDVGLGKDVTASNFGKVMDIPNDQDLAIGITNLVFQSLGTLAVAIAKSEQTKDVIFTGNMTQIPTGRDMLRVVSELYGFNFLIPENAEYATAIGAALQGLPDHDRSEK